MFNRYSIASITVVISSLTFSTQTKASNLTKIYAFGNSVSDTGNVFNLTGGTFPPASLYSEGRFSDGEIWLDDLSTDLGIDINNFYGETSNIGDSLNFAIGGATTGTTTLGDTPDATFPGVTTQVNDFVNFLDGNAIEENALVTLWAGENDYVEEFQDNGTILNPEIPVGNIADSLATLASNGAKNILVSNLVNIADVPLSRDFIPPEQLGLLDSLTDIHNNGLNAAVSSLEMAFPDTKFAIFDVNSLLDDIFENPTSFGFTANPIESCLSPNSFPDISPDAVVCSNPDQYVYYDNQHFTSAVHQLIADEAIAVINEEFSESNPTVPESGNPLATIGLGIGIVSGLVKKKFTTKGSYSQKI